MGVWGLLEVSVHLLYQHRLGLEKDNGRGLVSPTKHDKKTLRQLCEEAYLDIGYAERRDGVDLGSRYTRWLARGHGREHGLEICHHA